MEHRPAAYETELNNCQQEKHFFEENGKACLCGAPFCKHGAERGRYI